MHCSLMVNSQAHETFIDGNSHVAFCAPTHLLFLTIQPHTLIGQSVTCIINTGDQREIPYLDKKRKTICLLNYS
jgi:hypothetical protein